MSDEQTPESTQETSPAETKAGKKSKPDKKKPIAQPQPEEEPVVAEVAAEPSGAIEPPPTASETPSVVSSTESELPAAQAGAPADRNDDLFQQGVQSMLRGEYDAADNLFGQALLIYRKQGNQPGQVDVLEQLGHLCFLRGAQAQAREYYQQASSMRSG